jgi:hypothetical protein
LKHVGFCGPYYGVVKLVSSCCCSGCGCDEEVYWSEWHNDPPRCNDPCDCHGNWIGPSAGSYRAPYSHAYSPNASVARGSQPARAKATTANHRGAAAIVIRR